MPKFSVLIWETRQTTAVHEVEAEDYDAVVHLMEFGGLPTPISVSTKSIEGDYSISEVENNV